VSRAAKVLDSGAAEAHFDRFVRIHRGETTTLDEIVAQANPSSGRRGPLHRASASSPRRSLAGALSRPGGPRRIIAEVKRRSPSVGLIADIPDPGALAQRYQAQGAAAISVLTNGPHFGGSLADLEAVRAAVELPVLRKEFIVDPFQLDEAVAAGADAVLLIAAVLGRGLRRMLSTATDAGLEVLVEVHDEAELTLALEAGARIVGINNRDLRTFVVDLAVTERLAPKVSSSVILVAESGVKSHDDMRRLEAVGVSNFLVGEFLVKGGRVS